MQNYRHITGTQIADWAKTKEAQAALPRLIRRLIHASVPSSNCDFPSGDSTSSPGWDGELFCKEETPWTPEGQSYWELSCEGNPATKANRDYSKRTQQTDEVNRKQATLVIVTARKWSGKNKWLKKKLELKEWKNIRVLDADNLEQWLEQCPSVALQFAEELGISGPEVESISNYWETWSCQVLPAITTESFHACRENSRERLIADIRQKLESGQPSLYTINADSVEEAVAFTCSALLEQTDLASTSLVVTDSAGWRYVDMHPSLNIAIAARPEIAERPSRRTGLTVIIPYAAGDMGGYFRGAAQRENNADLIVERPDIYEFEKALIAMGISEGEAHRIAANTGRSWSVFRRRFSTNPAIRKPSWLDEPQAAALSTLCLLGAWSGDSAADRDIVSSLANRAYEEVEKELRYLSKLNDAPVLEIGKVWKAKSALELLDLFGERITCNELDRFFDIARQILSTSDPELELPEEQRYAAQIYGKVRPQSGLLIDALCNTLVKLAVAGAHAPSLAAAHIEGRVANLVHELLDEADETRWLSLSSHLSSLAEAAPIDFMKAVERSLAKPNAPVSRLITESGSAGVMGRCWHADLLWALETLAWSTNQFTRVALILARLVNIPIPGNWGNTPMGSLHNLFRSWLPQTAATIQQRIAALDVLIIKEPDVAFDLLDHIVRVWPDSAMPSSRPKWRSDDAGFGRGVSEFERQRMLIAAADRLLQLAEQRPQRIVKLIEKLNTFDKDRFEKTLSLIEPYTKTSASDEDRETIRAALRRHIHWHRNHSDKRAKALRKDVKSIEQLYHRLEPNDLLIRYRWLFTNGWVSDVPWREHDDYNNHGERIEKHRLESLREIYAAFGMGGIERLTLSCGDPYWVGAIFAKLAVADDAALAAWMITKGGDFRSGEPLAEAIRGLLHSLEASESLKLAVAVVDAGKRDGWASEKIARCLLLAPQNNALWGSVATYGSEVENKFWAMIQPRFWFRDDSENQRFVLERLLQAGRPRSALEFCQYDFGKVDTTVLVDMLERFLYGEEPDGPLLNSWHIGEALKHLQASQAIDKDRLVRLEFGLFPALGYGGEQQAVTLYGAIMSEPTLFTELLCILYKPRNSERENLPTEAEQATARTAWRILHSCKRQPGTQADGSIDPVAFIRFIDTARQLCLDADRLDVCDSTLGQILAHASPDEDDIWPCKPVRDVLDRPELEKMRNGFQLGARNKRGMTTRACNEGGGQERTLADFYRHQAQALAGSHVYLAATLEELAQWYEHDGQREDISAKLGRESY